MLPPMLSMAGAAAQGLTRKAARSAQRHRVDLPRHDQHHPDAFWRAAVMLEECVLLHPLPARNEVYGYGVAIACLEASGERMDTKFELCGNRSTASGGCGWTRTASPRGVRSGRQD